MNAITKLSIFDLDGSLLDTPEPEEGKKEWFTKTGKPWPYKGWWGQALSLSDIFNITPIDWIYNDYLREVEKKDVYLVLLTGRIESLRNDMSKWLDKFNIEYDEFIMKPKTPYYFSTADYKKKEILNLINKLPNINKIEIWDDQRNNIEKFEELEQEFTDIEFIIHAV